MGRGSRRRRPPRRRSATSRGGTFLVPASRTDDPVLASRRLRRSKTAAHDPARVIDLTDDSRGSWDGSDQARMRLQAICDVARRLATVHDDQAMLDVIVHEAERLLGSHGAAIRLLDGDDLVLKACTAPAATLISKAVVKRGESLSGIVVARGEPITVEDLVRDDRYDPVHRRAAAAHGFHGFLGVPLRGTDAILGALMVFTKVRREFAPDEISLLCTFADQASIAIEKTALLTETRAQAAALERQHSELTSFVSIVSHDLKTPLVSIEGMSGLLRDEFGPQIGDTGRRYLGRIDANVGQMERLVASLLVLSGIGRKSVRPEIVCLDRLVEGLVAKLGERGRVVSIRRDLGTVWAIRTELEQLFGHLLGNAIKFLGPTPSPAVELGADDCGDFIECYVRDNGMGIDPAYHERIFDMFQRLHADVEGSGVGLAVVRKIVETAGGRVWVESTVGHGATFRFTWPKSMSASRPDFLQDP